MIYQPNPFKRCTKCGEWRLATPQFFRWSQKEGIRQPCRVCSRQANAEYNCCNRDKKREASQRYRVQNLDKVQEKDRRYYQSVAKYKLRKRRYVPQQDRERSKRYYTQNKQKVIARQSEYRRKHPEKEREYGRRYRASHPDVQRAKHHRRRARKRDLPNTLTANEWRQAVAYFEGCCAYCGSRPGLLPGMQMSADHWIPLIDPQCPGTTQANILPSCKSCNSSKHDRNGKEWLISRYGKRNAGKIIARIERYFSSIAEQNSDHD